MASIVQSAIRNPQSEIGYRRRFRLFCAIMPTMRTILATALVLLTASAGAAGILPTRWRVATEKELRSLIPARAPVIKENIETEFRTASGVTDGRGKFIGGVVMITAGYSAEGKYSHFFITQVPLRIANFELSPGQYVFGYRRTGDETIRLAFYRAASGEWVGETDAHRSRNRTMIRSLLINPPIGGKANIQIGRFLLEYRVAD
jgi:hypothetical protein